MVCPRDFSHLRIKGKRGVDRKTACYFSYTIFTAIALTFRISQEGNPSAVVSISATAFFFFVIDELIFKNPFSVSTKAVQGAKSIGNFLFSAVNKAGETVSKAGAKIKKTVEENVST